MDMNCKGCIEGGQGHTDKCKFYPKVKNADPLGSSVATGYTQEQILDYMNNKGSLLTVHIIRNWERDKIERFAKHLLGNKCQECDCV